MEMMVVVIIITLLAAIAIPGMSRRAKSYRAKQAAEALALTYRSARLNAMGRGAATLVRYNAGTITVLEGIQGGNMPAGCEPLPSPACLTPAARWTAGNPLNQQLSTRAISDLDAALTSTLAFINPSNGAEVTARTSLDVCFTPMGAAHSDMLTAGTLARMTTSPMISVVRTDGVGFSRSVVVTPMGTTRVITTP